MRADADASWPWPQRYDFFATTRLLRTGRHDPTTRREPDGLWRTARLPSGPATVRIVVDPGEQVQAQAWGPGAAEALARVPAWLGLNEPPWELPAHPGVDRLLAAQSGLRLTDTGDVFEALVNFTLQQLVTWNEAVWNWRRLIEDLGEPAPGPAELRLLPAPPTLRQAGTRRLTDLGIGQARARTLIEIAMSARGLQRAAELPTAEAALLLERVRGVGPWTSASVLGMRLGRPEPIVRGDIHLPHMVAWALAREPRGSDARMEALLAPFAGQAFRVLRLVHGARIKEPRHGPRREVRFGRR